MPKTFVGESFSVSLTSGIEKLYASAGYVTIFDFLLKNFCLTVPKISVVESFTVALVPGSEKVWIGREGGVSRFSVENLCLTVDSFSKECLFLQILFSRH